MAVSGSPQSRLTDDVELPIPNFIGGEWIRSSASDALPVHDPGNGELLGRVPLSTHDDVDAAVADSSRFDVYKLVDAAVAGDAKRAVRILGGVRRTGIGSVKGLTSITAALVLLVAGTALIYAIVWPRHEAVQAELIADANSIAVLPFSLQGQQEGNEYLSDGIAEEILYALGTLTDFRVAARTSSSCGWPCFRS